MNEKTLTRASGFGRYGVGFYNTTVGQAVRRILSEITGSGANFGYSSGTKAEVPFEDSIHKWWSEASHENEKDYLTRKAKAGGEQAEFAAQQLARRFPGTTAKVKS